MAYENYNCQISCTGKSVIASIIIGVLSAVFRFTALITITPAFLWVLFGIAIGYLGINILTSAIATSTRTCCTALRTVIVSILGTALTSLILLGITFAATSVIGAIITGALLFFFSLLVTSTTCLIKCRYTCN